MANGKPDDYDVIIIGSGPGGSTVARELSRAGKKTLKEAHSEQIH